MSIDGVLKEDLNVKSIEEMPFNEKHDIPFFPELGLDRDLMLRSMENSPQQIKDSDLFEYDKKFKYFVIFGEKKTDLFEEIDYGLLSETVKKTEESIEHSINKNNVEYLGVSLYINFEEICFASILNKEKLPYLNGFDGFLNKFYEICLNNENNKTNKNYIPDILLQESVLFSKEKAINHLNKIWPEFKNEILKNYNNYSKIDYHDKYFLLNSLTTIRIIAQDKFNELNLDLTEINSELLNEKIKDLEDDNLNEIFRYLAINGYILQDDDGNLNLKNRKQSLEIEPDPLPERKNF